MNLSNRLQAIYDMLPKSGVVLDIGCDHCHLSIELVQTGKYDAAIASDVNREPLMNCQSNVLDAGIENITPVLSNGFDNITQDFDSVVISGMGGKLITAILSQRDDLKDKVLVLQPNSGESELRKYLKANGFKIYNECVVEDSGVLYTVIGVSSDGIAIESDLGIFVGPILKDSKCKLVSKKLEARLNHLLSFVESMAQNDRRDEVENEISILKKYSK